MGAVSEPILQLTGVGFAYPGDPPLLSGWSASIGAGITLLYGDTGAGKSTLLRVMAGALPATGELTLAGLRFERDPDAYRRQVFLADATSDAFEQVSARRCTELLRGDDAHFDEAGWQSLVDAFSLIPHIDKPMYMLSTGSRRKVWLAAALACARPLTLLDEPTGALDAASIGALWKALGRAAQQPGRAIVIASCERLDRVPLAATLELPLR